jgi:hypothetical protein
MGDNTGLILIAAAGGAFLLFNKQIMAWIEKNIPMPDPGAGGGDGGAGGDTAATSRTTSHSNFYN